ncbi:MAG: FAD-dependent thymidylate synthase [Promethearchaeota archaeon]|nr:MAG: FAD-dependent thymidylate synthase [Candidatus Lokiarchaeota archaeon]
MKVELLAITPDAEKHIENAGRTSYQSFEKQTKDSYKNFIKMIVKRGHESVLEHAFASFRISGVSRALTHQLVRHRLCSFTQKSQRYVDEKNYNYVEPEDIRNNKEAHNIYFELMEDVRKKYKQLRDFGIKKEDARYILPNSTVSELVMTANFRELRHFIKLRGEKAAQLEIRNLAIIILKILKKEVPDVFQDMEIDEENRIINIKNL